MCSFFLKKMENDQGDLADILRVTGGGGAPSTGFDNPVTDWQFPIDSMDFPVGIDEPNCDFSDPFPNDPLLRELDIASSMFFDGSNYASNQNGNISMMVTENENFNNVLDHQEIKKPYQLFSKMLQISPKMEIGVNNSSKKTGVVTVENSNLQPSSPRNPVIKRRKSQTKKVVCIPAPAAATSRPSGEVVPSDLWAWRKYGQKPIKGSPYPRGYYRCSSSKGCSARKQVERSRTDPNMLVITYTSEHNHPWPTQRNALAGSTRSQPLKNSSSSSKSSPSPQTIKPVKEEMVGDSIVTSETVKEEMGDGEKQMDDQEFEESFVQTYRPIPPNQNQGDDFFAELGELEVDPVDLMFPQGFIERRTEGGIENKYLDPFDLFDWSKNSLGETRRGL